MQMSPLGIGPGRVRGLTPHQLHRGDVRNVHGQTAHTARPRPYRESKAKRAMRRRWLRTQADLRLALAQLNIARQYHASCDRRLRAFEQSSTVFSLLELQRYDDAREDRFRAFKTLCFWEETQAAWSLAERQACEAWLTTR